MIEVRTYKEKAREKISLGLELIPGSDLLSHPPARAVPSAVAGLTSVFGMGTGVTLLLWPPGNLVPGIRFVGRGMRAAELRRTDRPRAYCDLMNQSFDRYLEFLSNSFNRNIKLQPLLVRERRPNILQSVAFMTTHSQSKEVNKWSSLTAD